MIKRVLIANRGEIAVRIIRAAFDEGIETVLVTSKEDRNSLPAWLADIAVCIGPAAATASYLDVDAIVNAAVTLSCDAIHPGYGFLSERPELATACQDHGILFVGPSVDTLRRGGDKTASRELAASLGIPVSRAVEPDDNPDVLRRRVAQLGYPVLVKAAAGGGGRGMSHVPDDNSLLGAVQTCGREAAQAFGDGRVFIERFIEHGRHVEVQILGDGRGNVVHLGERDCSVQRRYQKVVEEAPAGDLPQQLRTQLHDAAVELGRALDYLGAGTVEFLVDSDRDTFHFLEINTRLQVEHAVTEAVTGVDLVRAQLALAGGADLPIRQRDVQVRGHAIECRITSEDATRGFVPTPGVVERWAPPAGTDVRVDTHVFPGYRVPPFYDSLLAKLVCRGETRTESLVTTSRALRRFVADGIATNLPLLRDVVSHPGFRHGAVSTRWLENDFMPSWRSRVGDEPPHG